MKVTPIIQCRGFPAMILVLGLYLCPVLPASGAGFLKIGDIKGESEDAGHQDEIEVLSWSFGVSHDAGTSGSTRSGTTEFDGLVITKVVDVATPKLLEGCATGTTFPEAIITLQRSVGGASKTYLVIKLTGATVSSVSISGTGGEDRPTESASLNFTAIEMTYSQYKSDGSLAGNVVMSYDLSANTP